MSAQSQPRFSLATPTREFDIRTLRKLLYSAKSYQELGPAKKYLISYFARGDVGVYKWYPRNGVFKYYTKKDARDSFIQHDTVEFTNAKGEVLGRFSIHEWFFRETPFFTPQVDPFQPKIYRETDGGFHFNLFAGFLHADPPPFHQFSQEIRNKVKLIINHMKEVLCSSDEKQAYYMKNLVMRIAIGQKMQKTMFLYSGPGTGKTMLTWFLREMVLGPKISIKTANERIIIGQFNKELEGKCLLVLEEMSNSKSTDWITFANRLKDFVDSDTLMIEEKYRTPYPVSNITNLIINSNNSKTIRLDRDDRRYFIPDISDKYVENGIGMEHYYAPLDEAIKNPEVGKAFYSYALEYVDLNPDFNERKIPMTRTKLMMINRDNNAVHEFIKENYVCQKRDLEESSSRLYKIFKTWFESNIDSKKRPPNVQEFTCSLGSLGLIAKRKRVGDRKNDKKMQWYSATYSNLYATFMKKNMIDEAENIEEPEDYQHSEILTTIPPEVLPDEPNVSSNSASANSEPEVPPKDHSPITTTPEPAPKKVTPPVPPKPDHLKITKESVSKKPVGELLDDLLTELSGYIAESEPKSESQESVPKPESEESTPEPEPKPEFQEPSDKHESKQDPGSSKPIPKIKFKKPTKEDLKKKAEIDQALWEAEEEQKRLEESKKPKEYTDEKLESLYTNVKGAWERDDGPDVFDWEVLAGEIEDLPNHNAYNYETDRYHYDVGLALRYYWHKVSKGRQYNRIPYAGIAQEIREYAKKRGTIHIPAPEGYKTVSSQKLQESIQTKEMEREWADANGIEDSYESEDFSDNDDEFYNQAEKIHNTKAE
jgi:hypothetical protein